jgi:TonB family protein
MSLKRLIDRNPGSGQLKRFCLLFTLLLSLFVVPTQAQSGAAGTRASGRQYGVNLTFAVYQFDAARSPALEEITRLVGTFSTADDEIAHIKEKYRLEEVEVRHIRSVGLQSGQPFNDAVLLGPEYMVLWATPRDVIKGYMKLDFKVRYATEQLLDVKNIEMDNYETVILRGGRGMFGVKFFVGAGGRQESAPVERTLLISVTPEIVPLSSLRNQPTQLSHPVDQYGSPLDTKEGDKFTPPVPLDRVVPKFETGRGIRGSVILTGVVTPEGRVINVRVLRGIDSVIDERAVEAFRQYKFSPALLNGKSVHATYREELTFAAPKPTLLELQREMEKEREKEKEKEKKKKP